MLVHILSAKVVILCVEPYLGLNIAPFFSGGGAALYPQTSGPAQTPLGDRRSPSLVTGAPMVKVRKCGKILVNWHDRTILGLCDTIRAHTV